MRIRWLGRVPYREAWALQRAISRRSPEDYLLLLEHTAVYTLGTNGDIDHVLVDPASVGADMVRVDRGGDVTYHGPGQLVGYPIVRVDDVVAYVRTLERALVAALADEGVPARARPQDGPDYTGVWVQDRKIASIGVHVARGVTTHGFAVNVENDMQPFSWVVACGLEDVQMTSLIKEAGRLAGQMKCFRRRAAWQVAQALGRRQRLVSLGRLEAVFGAPASAGV